MTGVEHAGPMFVMGNCIIIPKPGREQILDLFHEGQPGRGLQNKGLACSYVWWPKIDADIEAEVKQYNQCQLACPSSPQYQCIHGIGQNAHGNTFTWIM